MAKLYHAESGTSYMDWLAARPDVRFVASPIAFVEFESVSAIKERHKTAPAGDAEKARRRLRADVASGLIRGTGPLTEQHLGTARRLIRRFRVYAGLRTLDAIHLAMPQELTAAGAIRYILTADQNLYRVAELLDPAPINPESPPRIIAP
ncbi:MAG: type II toxin-antitoxin system VapC family toxin [Acidobacteria bacterium]|nr:type II toxin-antitoxin system VapC family toxin [Acidobacteriota bacterium]